MNKTDFDEGVAYVRACLDDIHTRAEGRPLDETEQAAFDAGLAYIDDAKKVADRAQKLEQVRSASIEYVETGDGAAAAGERFNMIRKPDPEEIFNTDRASFLGSDDTYAASLRDRAVRSIEMWDRSYTAEHRESAEAKLHLDKEQYPGQGAAHILRTGNPHYVSAFQKIVRNPQSAMLTLDDAERSAVAEVQRAALAEGTTTTGGFMVPVLIDPTIILTSTAVTNPFRQIAKVITIGTETWKGITSAGVTAEWTAEAAEVTDASPTVAQPAITPIRADAYVQASMEMLQDTNISSDVAMLMGDARDRLEGTAFATGTGSTQPYGIVTELQLVTASRVAATTNGSYGAVDVFALDNGMNPRYRPNASWVANKGIYNLTRQMATGSGPQFAFWTDFGGAQPANLIGYPTYESSAMTSALSTATASNDDILILGDFRQYQIVDRMGMELVYNPLVLGANRRPTGEVGWVAFWRVGARVLDANAFRMLRV